MGLFDRFRSGPRPPKTIDRAVAFQLCAEKFIQRDWAGAMQDALMLGVEHKSLQILQILLISMQRIPHSPDDRDYQAIWKDTVDSIADTRGFDTVVLNLTLGRVSLDKAVKAAANDRERCKAYYYGGAQMVNNGETAGARMALTTAANIPDGGWERKFAEAELLRMSQMAEEKTLKPDTTAVQSAASVLRAAAARTTGRDRPQT